MKSRLFVFMLFVSALSFYAQVGIGTTSPDPSAVLDVHSNMGGFAMPRMHTSERMNITNPVEGLQVYDTDYNAIWFYDGTEWRSVGPLAYGRVDRDGSPTRLVGATVTRLGRGHYRITFNTPMPTDNYIIQLTLRQEDDEQRDDVVIYFRYLTPEKFDVYIQDNDNGYDNGTPEDNMFMFSVIY